MYVEGGGESDSLRTECRKAFNKLLAQLPTLLGRMPRIVAAGSRQTAYDLFCTAMKSASADEFPMLLVDSESAVQSHSKWEHVRLRPGDGWPKPEGAKEDQLFFMVQCMESWFLAERQKLVAYFGQGFYENSVPKTVNIEDIPKQTVLQSLAESSRHCKTKGPYSKSRHSFQILAGLDPKQIGAASPHADAFFKTVTACQSD